MIYAWASKLLTPVKPWLKSLPGASKIIHAARMALDGEYRALQLMVRRHGDALFQIVGTTAPNRYPFLFQALADFLTDQPAPRILSFGCSTGEELLALNSYVPAATLVGIDLNARAIRLARQRLRGIENVRLECRASAQDEPPAHYDAVLALAVFQRSALSHERPEIATPHLSFERVEAAWAGLDRCLKPGGILIIHHSHFRFSDSALYPRYQPLLSVVPRPNELPDYDADDHLVIGPKYREIMFRKIRESDAAHPKAIRPGGTRIG
jgi:SAM-dependent methyltransferase